MRPDMAKVIVERPRFDSRDPAQKKGYQKQLQLIGIDYASREKMLGLWRGQGRWFNEHLGPMRRFLRSQAGRPWNKVHQELCEFVSFDNVVQKHVLTHVYDYVQRVAVIKNGCVYHGEDFRRGSELAPGQMYVCPRTGILRTVRRSRSRPPLRKVMGNGLTQFLFRDNSRWEVQLRPRPKDPESLWDFWLERELADVTREVCRVTYGGDLFATSKRLLTRDEVRTLYRKARKQRESKRSRRSSTRQCPRKSVRNS